MITVHIPLPCHENWEGMTPQNNGRFCASCQKIVVDFTNMSDEQVKNYLLDHRHQPTCGRFLSSQTGRPLENQAVSIDRHWYAQLSCSRQVFYAFALFFVLGASSCNWHTPETPQAVQTAEQPDTLIANTPMGEVACLDTTVQATPPKKSSAPITEPVLTGDVYVTMGVPVFIPEPDTPRAILGKIAAPLPDTAQPEPKIMGGVSLPSFQDSTAH